MVGKLGSLTIDIAADVASLRSDMAKAEKTIGTSVDKISKIASQAALAIGSIGVGGVAGLAALTTNLADSAREIQQLATLSNASTDEFQKLAFGAARYGIEQDKVADILKDTNDKIGDFLQTGGGPLVDFFDEIGPAVGVTAEQFANLSGPQALQLYVDSIGKANLSQAEMTFFMEAIASDATALIPLLKDNGAEYRKLGEEAERTGNVLSDVDFENLEDLKRSTQELKAQFTGLGNEVALAAVPAINDLIDLLSDSGTVEAAKTLGNAIVTSITAATKAITTTVNVVKFLGEEIAAFVGGPAIDDTVRISEELVKQRRVVEELRNQTVVGTGANGVNAGAALNQAIEEKKLEDLEEKYRVAIELKEELFTSNIPTEIPDNVVPFPTTPRGPIGRDADTKTDEASTKSAEAIQRQIEALKLQEAQLGKTEKAAALYRLELEGATPEQIKQAEVILTQIETFERQDEAQQSYRNLVEELRTDEERLTEQLQERLTLIESIKDITEEERKNLTSRSIDSAFEEAPETQGISPEVGGAFSEFTNLDNQRDELEEWYSEQLELLAGFREQRADLDEEWDAKELELREEHNARLNEIDRAREVVALSATEDLFGNLAEVAKASAGEASGIYQALFAVEKAAAIARSIVAIQTGIANAASLPFPANLGAMATVAAATASIVSTIQSTNPSFLGGGFTGSGPRSGGTDGFGGFDATLHPNEVVIDLAQMSMGSTQTTSVSGGGLSIGSMVFPGITDANEAQRASGHVSRAIRREYNRAGRYE